MIRKLDHFVITTANLSACLQFYRILGFHVQDTGGRWELFSNDFKINVHVKGHEFEPKAMHVQTGSADFCFEIDKSLTACIEILVAHGIEIEEGIVTRHGFHGEMKSVYVRDPDGNLIELSSYE